MGFNKAWGTLRVQRNLGYNMEQRLYVIGQTGTFQFTLLTLMTSQIGI